MTATEIIKDCKNCFHYDICLQWSTEPLNNADWCIHFIEENIVNRQQKQIDELVERHLNHEEAVKKAKEACYQCQERHKEEIKKAKSEAYKECIKKVKEELATNVDSNGDINSCLVPFILDNLLKEMG